MRVEWRAVLDQFRAEINTQPTIASHFTFASQHRVSGWDPRSRPALVQLNAVTSPIFPGIGRSPVPVLLPFDTASYLEARQSGTPDTLSVSRYQVGLPSGRPVSRGAGRLRRGVLARAGCRRRHAAADICAAGRGADHRLDPHLRFERSRSAARANRSRRWPRNSPICAASSAKAMCATPSPASACPMWSRSSALTRTPRPRRLACREAYPVAERFLKALRIAGGQPSRPRTRHSVRHRRAAGGNARPTSAIAPAATSSPTAARAIRAATPTSRPIRKSAFPWKRPRPFALAILRQSANPTSEPGHIPGGTISARRAALRSANAPAASAIRGRTSAPRRALPDNDGGQSLRPQAAGDRRGPRRHRDPRARSSRRRRCRSTPAPSTSASATCT